MIMDYSIEDKKTQVNFTATSGDFSYITNYSYDANGNVSSINMQVNSGSIYLGNINISETGVQTVNLVKGADLTTHITNFETILAKINADVASTIEKTNS